MNINPLQTNIINLTSPGLAKPGARVPQIVNNTEGAFANILADAFRDVKEMDAADKASTLQLLTGQTDDISGLLIESLLKNLPASS